MGQRGEGVLIWGTPAGTVMVVQRQVGHIWGRGRPDLECQVCSFTTADGKARWGGRGLTYCHTSLQRCSNTVQRRWSCWQCVWCSRPSTGCWRIYGLLCDQKTLQRGGTTSQPHQNLRTKNVPKVLSPLFRRMKPPINSAKKINNGVRNEEFQTYQ